MASGLLLLFGVSLLVGLSHCVYKLELLDRLYLPYRHNPDLYQYDQDAAVDFAYDLAANTIYVVGQTHVHVVSAVSPYFLKHKFHVTVPGYELTDVEFCGAYVIVAADNLEDPEDGRVLIYNKYDPIQQTMTLAHTIAVGSLPDMVGVTKDCRTVIAVIEGEPYMEDGQLVDPLGGVTLIRFQSANLSGPFQVKKLDFSGFSAEEYEARGVRFIYKENGNTFARDLEPEYVTINEDETIAYIALQENNAIATVDISDFNTAQITEIYPLGYSDWSQSTLDASDRDGGINMKSWKIHGMYQPDTIKYFKLNTKPYIITMNEGDSKDYASWSEEIRGRDFVTGDMVDSSVDNIFRDELSVVSSLGRLKFSTASGKTPGSDKYSSFYSFGSRGFSFRSADSLDLVWDSTNAMETHMRLNMSNIFNANSNNGDTVVASTFDTRSDDKGPETEAGDVGEIGLDTVFFIGNERSGTIAIYSVRHDLTNPTFHSLNYGGNLTTSDSWEYQYDVRRIGDMDPEDIRFVSARESPLLGKDLLIVTGASSGTVAVYEVVDVEDGQEVANPLEVLVRRLFDMADINMNEYVTKQENLIFIMKEADLNEDGAVTEDELDYDWETNKNVKFTDTGLTRVFNALDTDNDGRIEGDDCDRFVDIITDKDGNGLLTIDEWRREWRGLLENNVEWQTGGRP